MYTFTAWTSYTHTDLVLIHTNAKINQLNQLCSSGVCITLYVYIYILPIDIYVYMCIYIYIYIYMYIDSVLIQTNAAINQLNQLV
jgi:hypothetical protein